MWVPDRGWGQLHCPRFLTHSFSHLISTHKQGEAWQEKSSSGVDAWAQEFNSAADENTFKEWERIYGLGQMHGAAEGLLGPLRE